MTEDNDTIKDIIWLEKDPGSKVVAIILCVLLALTIVLGIASIVWFVPLYREYLDTDPEKALWLLTTGLQAIFAIGALFCVVGGTSLFREGREIIKHAQTPVPGSKVVRGTRVLTGRRAIISGKITLYFGVFMFVFGIGAVLIGFSVVSDINDMFYGDYKSVAETRPPPTP